MTDKGRAIVIDNGSYSIKAGFAGAELPQVVSPCVVGRPKKNLSSSGQVYVGDEALNKAGILSLSSPIQMKNMEMSDMRSIWHHIFYDELQVDPSEHPVLMTEKPLAIQRRGMAEIMFETFNVPSFYLCSTSVLSLYSTGRTTGIVFENGHNTSYVTPIYEGFSIPHAIMSSQISGDCISSHLQRFLNDLCIFDFSYSHSRKILHEIKEKYCYVALDFEAEMKKVKGSHESDIEYELPDGNSVTISEERFRTPELLFKPNLSEYNYEDSVDKMVVDSIDKCNADLHQDLYANIVLAGGSTMFEGFPERFEKEIKLHAPKTMKVKVSAPTMRNYSAWIGGSRLASLPIFPDMVITRDEYNECDFNILRKCLS